MNETLYIYYIVPDINFVNEKETSEKSDNISRQLTSSLVKIFPLIILLLLLYLITRQ
jgi:hypothetical protein